MPIGSPSRQSTALFAVDCGRCCANRSPGRGRGDLKTIINNGQMLASLILGSSRCLKPITWRANPDVETTNWRARRGKTAHRVRRKRMASAVPYPYPWPKKRQSNISIRTTVPGALLPIVTISFQLRYSTLSVLCVSVFPPLTFRCSTIYCT